MAYAPPSRLQRAGQDLGIAETLYVPGFVDPGRADALHHRVRDEANWQRERFVLFGRTVTAPRLTAWYGDVGATYRYSGAAREAEPWPPLVLALAHDIAGAVAAPFNYVLVNRYRDGDDMLGWHSDDETDLGAAPVIAAVSVGAERIFRMRPRCAGPSVGQVLGHGSLLLMWGASQRLHKHCIPRTKKPIGERLCFTFRFTGQLRPARAS